MKASKAYALLLAILAFLFFLRVLGQVLVAFFDVSFLPPMHEWYSGLIPYQVLLPIQIAILALQAEISDELWRGQGVFATPRPRAGTLLRWFSFLYFTAMVLRYALAMIYHPKRLWTPLWFGGVIPIVFHWVLAGYLFVLSQYHLQSGRHDADAPRVA